MLFHAQSHLDTEPWFCHKHFLFLVTFHFMSVGNHGLLIGMTVFTYRGALCGPGSSGDIQAMPPAGEWQKLLSSVLIPPDVPVRLPEWVWPKA